MKQLAIKASADNLTLAATMIEPPAGVRPKGIIQLVHGMCEHKERYYGFMRWLSERGFVCIIHDHRGHGASVKSQRDLGYMYSGGWQAMVDDVKMVGDYARAKYPSLPFILLGHSMGSMVVRSYAKRYDDTINGLFVVGCPSDNPAKGAGKMLAKVFSMILGPHYRPHLLQALSFGTYNKPFKAEGWKSAWVCSDPETLKAYHADPLCQFRFTANGFYNLMGLMKDCYSDRGWAMHNPSLPIHFISGGDDPCRIDDAALNRAADFLRRQGYSDVDVKIYPGMRHEVLNETARDEVYKYILDHTGCI